MIKNLLFDFGGVVVPLNSDEAFHRFESLGITDARQRLGKYGQTGIFLQCERGEISAEEFCRQINVLAQQLDPSHPGNISMEQCEWAWRGYVTEVYTERLHNLLALKERFQVMLLSNTNPFMWNWANSSDFSADGLPISHYFHRTYCSFLLHDYKPSPTIFQTVLNDAHIMADETLFLDDGQANVDMARSLGIHAVRVEKNQDWMGLIENS